MWPVTCMWPGEQWAACDKTGAACDRTGQHLLMTLQPAAARLLFAPISIQTNSPDKRDRGARPTKKLCVFLYGLMIHHYMPRMLCSFIIYDCLILYLSTLQPSSPLISPPSSPLTSPQDNLPSPLPTLPSPRPTLAKVLLKHLMGLICLWNRQFTIANIAVVNNRLYFTDNQHIMHSYIDGFCLCLTEAE